MFWASLNLCSFYASYAAVSWQNQTPIAPLIAMFIRGQTNRTSYVNPTICSQKQKQKPQKPMDWILVGGLTNRQIGSFPQTLG